jgi:hypothetical protein
MYITCPSNTITFLKITDDDDDDDDDDNGEARIR